MEDADVPCERLSELEENCSEKSAGITVVCALEVVVPFSQPQHRSKMIINIATKFALDVSSMSA
jgi:hypothetical protein